MAKASFGAARNIGDAKLAAIEQWSNDPCGPVTDGEPGTRDYFERLLAGRHAYAPWMSEVLDYASCKGADVLDLGCGQGMDVVQYAAGGAVVTGVDLTPRHVELARQHLAAMHLSATITQGDAEKLDLADDTFDRVSSNGVLHHTPDAPAALREVRRVLRPGGEVRIIVYNRRSFYFWIRIVIQHGLLERGVIHEGGIAGVLSRHVEHTSIGARPLVKVYSPRQVRSMLQQAGFRSVATTVRHFTLAAVPLLVRLPRSAVSTKAETALGRIGGWYVIGYGTK